MHTIIYFYNTYNFTSYDYQEPPPYLSSLCRYDVRSTAQKFIDTCCLDSLCLIFGFKDTGRVRYGRTRCTCRYHKGKQPLNLPTSTRREGGKNVADPMVINTRLPSQSTDTPIASSLNQTPPRKKSGGLGRALGKFGRKR